MEKESNKNGKTNLTQGKTASGRKLNTCNKNGPCMYGSSCKFKKKIIKLSYRVRLNLRILAFVLFIFVKNDPRNKEPIINTHSPMLVRLESL